MSTDTNGAVVAPTNFWPANSNLINSVIGSAGLAAGGGVRFSDLSTTYFNTNGSAGNKISPTNLVDALIAPGAAIAQSKISGLTAALAAKLNVSGGTMTGPLVVPDLSTTDSGPVLFSADGGAATFDWDGTGMLLLKGAYLRLTNGTLQFAGSSSWQLANGAGAGRVGVSDANGFFSWATTLGTSVIPDLDAAKITSGTMATARLGSGTANSTTFLSGDQTYKQVADAQVASGAAIAKSKISTSSTWATADIPDLDAAKITSGTVSTNRLPTLVKDLGALTGVSGDLFYYDGSHLIRFPVGPEGFALIVSNGILAWSTNFSDVFITNLYATTLNVTTQNVSVLNISNTIKVNGKAATVFSANGTEMPIANLKDSTTAVLGVDATTNLTVNPTNLANAQVSASAAIGWSKISKTGSSLADLDTRSAGDLSSGTLASARLGTVQTTADGGSHSLKTKNYLLFASPHSVEGTGATFVTTSTLAYFGQVSFAAAGATTTNYCEYRITVPEDIDTSVNLKVERFKFRLGAADTAAHSYVLTMLSGADSTTYDSPSLGNSVTLSFAGDASGASGDVETISNVTLTNWNSNVTAGQMWTIRLARDGTDASTQISYSGPLVISYGSTQ